MRTTRQVYLLPLFASLVSIKIIVIYFKKLCSVCCFKKTGSQQSEPLHHRRSQSEEYLKKSNKRSSEHIYSFEFFITASIKCREKMKILYASECIEKKAK